MLISNQMQKGTQKLEIKNFLKPQQDEPWTFKLVVVTTKTSMAVYCIMTLASKCTSTQTK